MSYISLSFTWLCFQLSCLYEGDYLFINFEEEEEEEEDEDDDDDDDHDKKSELITDAGWRWQSFQKIKRYKVNSWSNFA